MGRLARILSFARAVYNGDRVNEIAVDPGGGPNVTAQHMQPSGDDAQPLRDDYAFIVEDSGTGREAVVGFVDPINDPLAGTGERYVYGRNSAGTRVNFIGLRNNGEIVISNGNGTMLMAANGSVNINGAVIDTSGNITSPGTVQAPTLDGTASVLAAGNELVGHDHPYVGLAPGVNGITGPNNP